VGYHTSVAEEIASRACGARVFKTFTLTGFENTADAGVDATRPVMLVVGNDAEGKAAVLSLVADLGFNATDAGVLQTARILEGYGMGLGEISFLMLSRG
jgi:predicted dinucleotide-binding enzyme